MRIFILCCLTAIFFSQSVSAQGTQTVSRNNLVSDKYTDVYVTMPDYREIKSGSKLVVTYEGEWPAEAKGAFEHAVRLWEEVLPMTMPIKITAKIGTFRGLSQIISNVKFKSIDFQGQLVKNFSSPTSMVKSVCLRSYLADNRERFYNEISDTTIFEETDFFITYNIDKLDQFNFSIEGVQYSDKYDFVTFALRDIAIGLGFATNITANVANGEIEFTDRRPHPFELKVLQSLDTKNPGDAFLKATQGNLTLNAFPAFSVYAPESWLNGVSLNYFIPSDHPLTRLLSYDFGKGYVMRDLSADNWDEIFQKLLEWQLDIRVSTDTAHNSLSTSGSSNDILPYTGAFCINRNLDGTNSSAVSDNMESVNLFPTDTNVPASETEFDEGDDFSEIINGYCKRYDLSSPTGPAMEAYVLCVMKQDGTWDELCEIPFSWDPIIINMEDLTLHYPEEEYARGTTGGLRYRLTYTEKVRHGYKEVWSYRTKYFTRDYTPQKPEIKYTKALSKILRSSESLASYGSDDYFVDVKVGISNIEGAKRVVVEQLDEGEPLPFRYEVEDFRNGYFIANLDRSCSTALTVISYNENGYRRSNTITIPAIGYDEDSVTYSMTNNIVTIYGLSPRGLEAKEYHCIIQQLIPANPIQEFGIMNSNVIDLSRKAQGLYGITIYHGSNAITSFKVQVK